LGGRITWSRPTVPDRQIPNHREIPMQSAPRHQMRSSHAPQLLSRKDPLQLTVSPGSPVWQSGCPSLPSPCPIEIATPSTWVFEDVEHRESAPPLGSRAVGTHSLWHASVVDFARYRVSASVQSVCLVTLITEVFKTGQQMRCCGSDTHSLISNVVAKMAGLAKYVPRNPPCLHPCEHGSTRAGRCSGFDLLRTGLGLYEDLRSNPKSCLQKGQPFGMHCVRQNHTVFDDWL